MSLINVSIRADGKAGVARLQSKFKRLAKNLRNKQPLFKRIGVKLLNEIDTTFKTEDFEGKRWTPLAPATTLRRRRGPGIGSARILQDTGTLRQSFVMDVGRTKLTVGTPVDYSETHEEGLGNVPQRRMLPSEKRTLEIAVDTTEKLVKEQIRNVRLK